MAKLNLDRQGFITYLPLLQQHKRRHNLYKLVAEPLFPRYLFIYLNSTQDDWSKIRSTRGCVSLVRFGAWPAQIPAILIEKLQQDEASQYTQKKASTPDFKPGDKVQIIDGMLVNYEGFVETKHSQQRITLLLAISENHTRRVNLSIHQIKAAS